MPLNFAVVSIEFTVSKELWEVDLDCIRAHMKQACPGGIQEMQCDWKLFNQWGSF
jgi:hypothetical protein